ncbi:hypothetical protein SCHPADRAFT_612215 [Schizopora paradoxa]|uniref:Helitron helicase-like domain-containing protein n=1 Tax=Schizopora paradoxa TaxID=27342 RepID=A0A0H2RFL3_9AGAM|nr:hypothetical protein SCHPADRAFT_612215 [Schizopora paradoxa]
MFDALSNFLCGNMFLTQFVAASSLNLPSDMSMRKNQAQRCYFNIQAQMNETRTIKQFLVGFMHKRTQFTIG